MKSGMLFTKKMSFFWLLIRAKSSRLAGQVAKSQEPGKKSQVKRAKWEGLMLTPKLKFFYSHSRMIAMQQKGWKK